MAFEIEHVALTCSDCGSNKFSMPNQPALDADIVSCADCGGEVGRHDDLRGALRAAGPNIDAVPSIS